MKAKHEVTFEGYGKGRAWFNVKSGKSGEVYSVSVNVNCSCIFCSVEGSLRGVACSHSRAAVNEWVSCGGVFGELNRKRKK